MVCLLNVVHVIRHNGADGLAGGEEKIGYIDFIFIKFLCNRFSILIDQAKICYAVVFFLVLNGAVYQLIIDLCRLVNRQCFYRIQDVVKQSDNNAGQHKEGGNEQFIFFKKGIHRVVIVPAKVQYRTGNFEYICLKMKGLNKVFVSKLKTLHLFT